MKLIFESWRKFLKEATEEELISKLLSKYEEDPEYARHLAGALGLDPEEIFPAPEEKEVRVDPGYEPDPTKRYRQRPLDIDPNLVNKPPPPQNAKSSDPTLLAGTIDSIFGEGTERSRFIGQGWDSMVSDMEKADIQTPTIDDMEIREWFQKASSYLKEQGLLEPLEQLVTPRGGWTSKKPYIRKVPRNKPSDIILELIKLGDERPPEMIGMINSSFDLPNPEWIRGNIFEPENIELKFPKTRNSKGGWFPLSKLTAGHVANYRSRKRWAELNLQEEE